MSAVDVVVVGAGLSGLTAARRLGARGASCLVIEKSAGLGGRLATRRIGGVPIDHGCPILDVPPGTDLARDVAALGPEASRSLDGDDRRIVLREGMTALAKSIAAGLTIRRPTRVGALVAAEGGIGVLDAQGDPLAEARCVIVSAPGPQAAELIRTAGDPRASALAAVPYDPALVVLAQYDEVTAGRAIRSGVGDIARVVDEGAKRPTGGGRAVVSAHVAPETSRELLDVDADEEIAERLLPAIARMIGADGPPRWWQLKRWRYAVPRSPRTHPAPPVRAGRILLCGDSLAGADLAATQASGRRAADAALALLG